MNSGSDPLARGCSSRGDACGAPPTIALYAVWLRLHQMICDVRVLAQQGLLGQPQVVPSIRPPPYGAAAFGRLLRRSEQPKWVRKAAALRTGLHLCTTSLDYRTNNFLGKTRKRCLRRSAYSRENMSSARRLRCLSAPGLSAKSRRWRDKRARSDIFRSSGEWVVLLAVCGAMVSARIFPPNRENMRE